MMKIGYAFDSRRSPVYGKSGMVAASQPLAVAAGISILNRGGTAADAAVAVAAALNVTEPCSTGLGGDAFALYYEASSGEVSGLNGSGRAPGALSLKRLHQEGFTTSLPPLHPYTITVPGACSAWTKLVSRFGRLSLSEILTPAIRLADEGFAVSPLTARSWQAGVDATLKKALNGQELTIHGRAPHAGEIFRNKGLANTLRLIADDGARAFYEGPIAEAIVAIVQEAGGCLTPEDLARHTPTWDIPISTLYRGLRVWECAPNGQGLAALLALNILEGYDLGSMAPYSGERLHLMIEAMRLAFADARYFVADPAFVPAPLEALLSKAYAAERRQLIDMRQANGNRQYGHPLASSDTVYFCVVDGQGNACSFINSNYMGFGTGIVPQRCGFSLQNRGHNFSLQPGHPNVLAPGKRPYHTIIPAMATREDGSLYAAFGVMGGFMQPQGHVQVLSALIDDGVDPQTALNRSRFCVDGEKGTVRVQIEEGIPLETMASLAGMGHHIIPVASNQRGAFGRGQVILRDPKTGVLCGGSDPRADGCVMCLG